MFVTMENFEPSSPCGCTLGACARERKPIDTNDDDDGEDDGEDEEEGEQDGVSMCDHTSA